MTAQPTAALVLTVPEFYADAGFLSWLSQGDAKCTTYRGGEPDDWAEVVVLVDPGLAGEGSASDMPEWCWDAVLAACRECFCPRAGVPHILVNLRNAN